MGERFGICMRLVSRFVSVSHMLTREVAKAKGARWNAA